MFPLILPEGYNNFDVLKLPHPLTSLPIIFILSKETLFQVSQLSQNSCFINQQSIQDGNIRIFTLYDPLFILISLLESRSTKMFMSIDDIFHHDIYPDISKLFSIPGIQQRLELICSTNESIPGELFYKYDELKIMNFISKKFEGLLSNYDSYEFFDSKESDPLKQKMNQMENISKIMSEFISSSCMKKLLEKYEIKKTKIDASLYYNENNSVAPKRSNEEDINSKAAILKKKKGSNALKSLEKVNKRGMKSINAFFNAK